MKKIIATIAFALVAGQAFPQALPDSMVQKIDQVFSRWDNQYSPGCTIGIILGDSLIFTKGYGMANLEYNIQNGPETIYHMASVSKEFTGYAMVLLAKQGRLNLDDDIRKYLTWFPDMKEKITIRHLLNHTSGIRDQWQLLAISGTRLDDVITQEHIVKLLSKQRELNFKPGERFLYCNSGYTMCAEIVKAVTGKTLRQFTDSAIFKPLGMNSTHFHDDYTEIEKNRAYSYSRRGVGYANSVLSYSNAGATSLFTNIPDLSKWVMNYYHTVAGDPKDIEKLTKKGLLNSGRETDYALGIVSNTYKGWRQYSHGGSDAGFRTYLSVFPDLKMGFLVFSNFGEFNSSERTYALADLFIKDTSTAVTTVRKIDSSKTLLTDSSRWKVLSGNYITDEGMRAQFNWLTGRLSYIVNNNFRVLASYSRDTLADLTDPARRLVSKIEGPDTLINVFTPGGDFRFKKFQPGKIYSDEELKKYTGTYYSDELDCSYSIILKDHQLYLANPKYPDARLNLVGDDQMNCGVWWMNNLVVQRGKKKEVTGFEVNNGRVLHLKFKKI
ncbi:MAG TPA: serine hydrolase domain-containing protein [Chitinophagaceae bacterium]|nr:serine hydrolase domain-containing protein [Chitinophagaceae bacterium]